MTMNTTKENTTKEWHATLAKYNPKKNGVEETRLHNFDTSQEAQEWINSEENRNKAVCIWHDEATNLINPGFATAETVAYRKEYSKIEN